MKIQLPYTYTDIISSENLLEAWKEFVKGKRNKSDVMEFSLNLIRHSIQLHNDLENKTYRHGPYHAFNISDPKPRNIHKASVRDRLLHHALHRKLYPFFDTTFIADSYSCRDNKGTHKAMNRFQEFAGIVSKNNIRTAWVLQCDIRKFFASIDQGVLIKLLKQYIPDRDILSLLTNIIQSFEVKSGKGLPLGNLTSQLLVNIYMNEFDQFMKHTVKASYYLRYADDFAILSHDSAWLESILPKIRDFLQGGLRLHLHPHKLSLRTVASGIDFLGWVHFPYHRVVRTTTKRRMFKRIQEHPIHETVQSYLGLLQHGNAQQLSDEVKNLYYL